MSRVADVAAWLRNHGIVAHTSVPEAPVDVGEQLDKIATNVGAGVVVAGAYGHSRFREWVLSGVTRHLVTNRAAAHCCRAEGRMMRASRA